MASIQTWRVGTCVVTAVLAAACAKDPAGSVKIALGGLIDGGVAHGAERTRRSWRPSLCPPPTEPPAPAASHLVLGGACAFEHGGPVHCDVRQDDLYVTLARPANEGAVVTLYVNVERYQGPGPYEAAEVQLTVRDRGALFRWASNGARVNVESGETGVRFDRVVLSPEPGTSTEGDEWLEGVAVCGEHPRGN
jgi:hypothetical protein